MMPPDKIVILTGPVHSGKTTALLHWITDKKIAGMLTPIVDSKRVLYSIEDGDFTLFETAPGDSDSVKTGKYHLSFQAFKKSASILDRALLSNNDWIVIDEIGPLELDGQGFYHLLVNVLDQWSGKLLLVVRFSILSQVIDKFDLNGCKTVEKEQLLMLT
jgi:nucleoside-triphosphatase THEP1